MKIEDYNWIETSRTFDDYEAFMPSYKLNISDFIIQIFLYNFDILCQCNNFQLSIFSLNTKSRVECSLCIERWNCLSKLEDRCDCGIFFDHVPKDILEEFLSEAAGNSIVKPIETNKVCSECDGKKILDFGFYTRQCMKCSN